MVWEVLSGVCLVAGSLFAVIGGVGIVRLPDFYARMHAGGITDTLGAWLILLGLILHEGPTLITVKLVMIGLLLAVTSPTSTHALANSAWRHGQKPWHAEGDDDVPAAD